MKRTAFIFGRTPLLSILELQSFYPNAQSIIEGISIVSSVVDAPMMINTLGGTVKIAQIVSHASSLEIDTLFSSLLKFVSGKHITFGISSYGGFTINPRVLTTLKKQLSQRGVSARYVETKHNDTLSSVVVSKQQVVELVVIKTNDDYLIGVTQAVQDFEDWNKRDFGRPASDPKAGMLPPKVARMIVNIALLGNASDRHSMFLDPFCGVGTILAEALLRGANTVGCDLSEVACGKAKKNLEWLRHAYPVVAPLYANIITCDATHLAKHIAPCSVDAVATEPYMGGSVDVKGGVRLMPERIKDILKGLEKLYIGALREWMHVLKPNARVVMAMPEYVIDRGIFRVKNVVDRCESLGYTLLTGPIEYSRPQAVVRREFYVFQKS